MARNGNTRNGTKQTTLSVGSCFLRVNSWIVHVLLDLIFVHGFLKHHTRTTLQVLPGYKSLLSAPVFAWWREATGPGLLRSGPIATDRTHPKKMNLFPCSNILPAMDRPSRQAFRSTWLT